MKYDSLSTVNAEERSLRSGLTSVMPTLAQQHMRDQCDINFILRKFGQGIQNMPANVDLSRYGDFTGIDDYQSALDFIRAAGEDFAALPSTLRDQFHNDPQKLIAFVSSDENYEAATKMGLLDPNRNSAILDVTVPTDTKTVSPNPEEVTQ